MKNCCGRKEKIDMVVMLWYLLLGRNDKQ